MREGLTSKESGFTLVERTEKGTLRQVLLAANSERDKADWLRLLFSTQSAALGGEAVRSSVCLSVRDKLRGHRLPLCLAS
eukprot:SAG22_NODE_1638_length_3912_cov_5.771046_4_plen_80_part_00